MAEKRRRLACRRKSLGFTQESLAAVLRVDRTTIERWENGRRDPQPWIRPRLANALELSVDELDQLINDPDTVGNHEQVVACTGRRDLVETDDMQRQELLRVLSMVGTAVTLPVGISAATDAPATTDHAILNGQMWRIYSLAPAKSDVLPLVRRQLATLADKLTQSRETATRRQLCALTAEAFQLAGEIFFDGNAYTDAAHCYALAAQASREAGAFDLWACAMTRHAYLSVYEQRFDSAEPMLGLAASLARRGDTALSTRHWVAAVQAETYAGMGDLDACQRALDTAEEVHALTGPAHNGGWLRFDGARLAEERGTCYARLGCTDLAETALHEALRQRMSPRRRTGVLTDLAVVGVQRRDPDQVVSYGNAALAEARRSESGMIGRKLGELQRRLSPLLGNRRIRQLNDDITAKATPT